MNKEKSKNLNVFLKLVVAGLMLMIIKFGIDEYFDMYTTNRIQENRIETLMNKVTDLQNENQNINNLYSELISQVDTISLELKEIKE